MKGITKLACFFVLAGAVAGCGGPETSSIEIDMKQYPNYVENLNEAKYSFGDKELQDPFWLGNIMYNESVLMMQKEGETKISGKLLYTPKKIISVYDYTLEKEYVEGTDFKVEGNEIILLNTGIEYRTEAEVSGSESKEHYAEKGYILDEVSYVNTVANIANMGGTIYTESKFYYGAQLWVSYAYDLNEMIKDKDVFPSYSADKLPLIKDKLEKKEPLKIVGLGDSVLEGCSSSGGMNHKPFLKNFMEYTKDGLERLYGTNVILDNQAVGGKDASWGSENTQLNKVIAANPDLLILHFGINDLGAGHGSMQYYDDMQSIVLTIKNNLPNVSILLLSPFAPFNGVYGEDKMEAYAEQLTSLALENDNTAFFDMYHFSKFLENRKNYYDMTGNGINHVNDFASRIYVQSLLQYFYDFQKGNSK